MKITALAHVCIYGPDLPALERFYCGALGLKKQFDFLGKEGRAFGFYLQVNEHSFVEVFESDAPAPASRLLHLCLETEDIHALHRHLETLGYQPKPVEMGADESWQFWIADPSGMELEFHQYTPESSQLTGRSVKIP